MPSPVKSGRTHSARDARGRAQALARAPGAGADHLRVDPGGNGVVAEQQVAVEGAAHEGDEGVDVVGRVVLRRAAREGGRMDVAGRRQVVDGQGAKRHHLRKSSG